MSAARAVAAVVVAFMASALLPLVTGGQAHASSAPPPGAGPDVEVLGSFNDTPGHSATYRGRLYFSASTPATGTELWVTDGTPAGTRLAVDLAPGALGSGPRQLTVLNDRLLFTASARTPDGALSGVEWWSTDGTPAGTRLVADIFGGAGGSDPHEPTMVGDHLYFVATHPQFGRELWWTDGTFLGTKMAVDFRGQGSGSVRHLTSFGDRLVFTAEELLGVAKPWVTFPGQLGAKRLDSLPLDTDLSPREYTRLGGRVLFAARNGTAGDELWATRGEPGDAEMVRDIAPNNGSSAPSYLTLFKERVLFAAATPMRGRELWITDGTTIGTQLVADIEPAYDVGSDPRGLTVLGDRVLFGAAAGGAGVELWSSSGTAASTTRVADAYAGPSSHLPHGLEGLVVVAGKLVYLGRDAVGDEPWVTDGSRAGTRRIADLAVGAAGSDPRGLGTIVLWVTTQMLTRDR